MSWVRIDDTAPEHPKMLKAGPAACWLWVCGNAWCSRHLTNGEIPREAVALFPVPHQFREAARLVDAKIWEKTKTGYRVHDYLKYHPSAAQVKHRRQKTADRVANWKVTHGKVGKNAQGNGVTKRVTNASGTHAPDPVPDPDPLQEERTAAPPPLPPVENSNRVNGDVSGFTRPAELAPFTVVSALVRGLLAEEQDFHYPGGEADLLDTIKTRCAKARLGYDSELVRKALDSERVKATHRRTA